MSKSGTSRENCLQGKDHGNAYRQRQIYNLLQENGPMLAREIADEIDISVAAARSPLQKLRRDGYVKARPSLENPSNNVYEVVADE